MGSRWPLMSSPWFLGSILLLVVNDHVLKDAWPGLVTGKLSDVAGVAMVAIALTAVVGRPAPAAAATAVAFTLLKTVPDVAVWAAPILGGRTRTDPTDLVALLVLVPLWRWLADRSGRSPDRSAGRVHLRVAFVRLVAVVAAVGATTATSCDDPSVDTVRLSGERFEIDDGARVERSLDGVSWEFVGWSGEVASPADVPPVTESCTATLCWRVDGSAVLERPEGGGEERIVFRYSDAQLRAMERNADSFCGERADDGFRAVAARADGTVVVAMGSHGVVVRDPSGRWERYATAAATPISFDDFQIAAALRVALIVGPVVLAALGGLVVAVAGRRPRRRWIGPPLASIQIVGMLGVWMLVAMGPGGAHLDRVVVVIGPVMFVVALAMFVPAVIWARRPLRPLPPPSARDRVG